MPNPMQGRDLTTGRISRHLLHLALPMLAGNLLNTGYGVVNTLWVGRIAGELAVRVPAVDIPRICPDVLLVFGHVDTARYR
jgi:Na+-driven multidrug efflux pump